MFTALGSSVVCVLGAVLLFFPTHRVKLVAQGKNATVSYHLTEPAAGAGAVLDSGFMHTNWCGSRQDVLVATPKTPCSSVLSAA